jgi:hypothetical protein
MVDKKTGIGYINLVNFTTGIFIQNDARNWKGFNKRRSIPQVGKFCHNITTSAS